MTTGPGPQGEGVDDFITQQLRARGLFGAERSPSQELWLPGATVAQARRWVGAAFPGPLAALHHGRQDDVHFTAGEVSGGVVWKAGRLLVSTHLHDGGFLHAVAQRAAEEGVAGLVVDGDSFYGAAGYVALTEYRAGAAPRTEWFDPLRGLEPDAATVRAWLATYLDERKAFLDWLLDPYRDRFGTPAGTFILTREGKVLPLVRWVTEPGEPEPAPVPGVQVFPSAEVLHEATVGAAEPVSSVVSIVVLSLISLSVCVLGASLMGPRSLLDALIVCGACAVLVGWLALVPLRWPSGRPVPWAARLAWFGAPPVVVPLVMYFAGGTT